MSAMALARCGCRRRLGVYELNRRRLGELVYGTAGGGRSTDSYAPKDLRTSRHVEHHLLLVDASAR